MQGLEAGDRGGQAADMIAGLPLFRTPPPAPVASVPSGPSPLERALADGYGDWLLWTQCYILEKEMN